MTNNLKLKEISQLIENQFPALYREEGPMFVSFLEAYYEWLETSQNSAFNEGRLFEEISDIDTTMDQFLDHFKTTYLDGFPYDSSIDTRFLIKHVMDYYRSKGTKQGTKLLMKMLFGEEVEIYYPSVDIFKASSSTWKVPRYIEVSQSDRSISYLNKQIFGARSGASAFVESVIRKRIAGKIVDIIYITGLKGDFTTGEAVSDDGYIEDAPRIIGSFSEFVIDTGGRGNKIGDIFDVVSDGGTQGKIRVTGIANATGRVDFKVLDGGHGYTLDDNTRVLVSNTVLYADLSNIEFLNLENVYQPNEKINMLSANTFIQNAVIGDLVVGVDSANNQIATGKIVSIEEAGANSSITVLVDEGSFLDQLKLDVDAIGVVSIGEKIREESTAVLTLGSSANTISVGMSVEQYVYHPDNTNVVVSYATAKVIDATDQNEITVGEYFGTFLPGTILIDGLFNAVLTSSAITDQGAVATISNIVGTEISISNVVGTYEVGKKVKTEKTRNVSTITSVQSQGASDVILSKNGNAAVIDTTEDNKLSGVVVGQNTSSFGVFGNSEFYTSNTHNFFIKTDRSNLLSPPKDANGNIIELTIDLKYKSTGSSAGFNIGALSESQVVNVAKDFVGANNVVGVNYVDIKLNGYNSGVGMVENFQINNGGTGYSNGQVITLNGGGFANSQPFASGSGTITTDANGTITSITVESGSGYYQDPTITLPTTTGTVANVSVVMSMGYGFPAFITGDENAVLADLFETENMTIGSIASITAIRPGVGYNTNPYIKIVNPTIASYSRGNFIISLFMIAGSFQENERIYQEIGGVKFYKGTVKTYSQSENYMIVDRELFETDFQENYPIIGTLSGSIAEVLNISPLDENVFGKNADVSGKVIAADGIMTSAEVIVSGYGYVEDAYAELVSPTNPYAVTGKIRLGKSGKGEGYWQSTNSHLNSNNKIHDNKYYQEFSYDIISSLPLSRYANIVKKVNHVAGTRMFGSINRTANYGLNTNTVSEIEII